MSKFNLEMCTTEREAFYGIRAFNDKNGSKATIEKYEGRVLKLKNPALSFYFAYEIKGANIEAHEQVVLESGDPEWNYYFSREIEGADINAHRQKILDSGDPEWNYRMAQLLKQRNQDGAELCEEKVIKSGNSEWNYHYAFALGEREDGAHEKIVRGAGIPKWIYFYEHDIQGLHRETGEESYQKRFGELRRQESNE